MWREDESGSKSAKTGGSTQGSSWSDHGGRGWLKVFSHVSVHLRGSPLLLFEKRHRFSKNKGGRADLVFLSHPGDFVGKEAQTGGKMLSSIFCHLFQMCFLPKSPYLAKFYVYQHRLFFFWVKKVAFCDDCFFKKLCLGMFHTHAILLYHSNEYSNLSHQL